MSLVAACRLYLVAPARIPPGDLSVLLPDLIEAGVDLVQLREKEAEALEVMRAASPLVEICRGAGVPFIVNDRPDIALAVGADGVHLGQGDLPAAWARRIIGTGIVGRSSHAAAEIDAEVASETPLDYIAVGPVHETPTKPGRPGTGLELAHYAAGKITAVPWFVTGNMNPDTLPAALETGVRRIVVVRAITEAPDPVAAAARLRAQLDAVPL